MDSYRSRQVAPPGTDEENINEAKQEKIVQWLNDATLSHDASIKTTMLFKVQEVILNLQPTLLDNFLHEVLAFQNDRNIEVRKFVVGFLEEIIKRDIEILPKVIINIQVLLQDKSAQVQKRVVQTVTQIYRQFLMWISKAVNISDEMQAVWNVLTNMKAYIINMVDSENDGLRTQIVKFLETLVLLQTYMDSDSCKRPNDFALDNIPFTLKIARRRKLEEEALTVFDLMLKFHGSSHISSANLMACMSALTSIGKLRPQFIGKVIDALESSHLNLPPTLSTSQVSSVRKHLKMQLLGLLRHPSVSDYLTNITTLLTDLGATNSEVMKAMPRIEEQPKKRSRRERTGEEAVLAKKQRVEDESAVDITEAFVVQRLTPELAANMVITFMGRLPDTMPSVFSATYTPIAAAGTQGQIRHVARLIASQLNAHGLGPGATIAPTTTLPVKSVEDEEMDEDNRVSRHSIPTLVTRGPPSSDVIVPQPESIPVRAVTAAPTPIVSSRRLTETKPLPSEVRDRLEIMSVQRILSAEAIALRGGVNSARIKLLATLAASFSFKTRDTVLQAVQGDLRNQVDLALAWLYEEYSLLQGFTKRPPNQLQDGIKTDHNYHVLLNTLISTVMNNRDMKEREMVLTRLFTEAPFLTDDAIDLLKTLSSEEVMGLNIAEQLISLRPPKQLRFLNIILVNTANSNPEIREKAVAHAVKFYEREEMRSIVEEFAVMYIGFLRLPTQPEILVEWGRIKTTGPIQWTDDSIKACLYLYMALLPCNQHLVHELSHVYLHTSAEVKRVILRIIEAPVRKMGMDSPDLLRLLDEFPKGCETLVTRIIQTLTDKVAPTPELVARVRNIYQRKVMDVRFLIPVLNGLSKDEILTALPKFIKLNPNVVKEVFNRLLGSHGETLIPSPITPSELLIALHTIDPSVCELKLIIKATSLCFADTEAYTQEVLAVVMQHLMEMSPLPTLLMRTVIQALSLYPRLMGFVMNILQRLILKQVWKQRKVWEGFIKCCQRTTPHSYQVLLQLPAPQLEDVFNQCPELKQPLLDHIMAFTENQRAHIPQTVMDILLGTTKTIQMNFKIKEEPMSPPELTIDMREDYEDPPKVYYEPAPPGME